MVDILAHYMGLLNILLIHQWKWKVSLIHILHWLRWLDLFQCHLGRLYMTHKSRLVMIDLLGH